jgi:hypothetical protein
MRPIRFKALIVAMFVVFAGAVSAELKSTGALTKLEFGIRSFPVVELAAFKVEEQTTKGEISSEDLFKSLALSDLPTGIGGSRLKVRERPDSVMLVVRFEDPELGSQMGGLVIDFADASRDKIIRVRMQLREDRDGLDNSPKAVFRQCDRLVKRRKGSSFRLVYRADDANQSISQLNACVLEQLDPKDRKQLETLYSRLPAILAKEFASEPFVQSLIAN